MSLVEIGALVWLATFVAIVALLVREMRKPPVGPVTLEDELDAIVLQFPERKPGGGWVA